MGRVDYSGLTEIIFSFDQIAEIPDDVAYAMLAAQGKVVAEAHKRKIKALGLVKTGKMLESIEYDKRLRKGRGSKRFITVYPKGTHHFYNRRLGGDKAEVTNAEVAFIHEFGTPKRNIPAKQWMKLANEGCADEAVAAAQRVYDDFLKINKL